MSVPPVPRRSGLSLVERSELTRQDDTTRTQPPPGPAAAAPGGRHCWVSGLPGAPGVWPGLLTAWRQHGGTWQGQVTYAVVDGPDTVLIQSWVPAEHLRPSDQGPP